MNNTKAILFDFNGTLFNDTLFHVVGWKRYAKKRFGLDLTEEQIYRICIGPPNRTILNALNGSPLPEELIRQYSDEKDLSYQEYILEDPARKQLVKGVPEMLDMIASRGIPFAMATASYLINVRFYMETLGMNRWFTMDRVLYENGRQEGKPHPQFYTNAAALLGLKPSECTIVEDSPTGIQGAVNAGAGRLIVITNTKTREELSVFPQIDAFINDFTGFEQYI